MKQPKFEIAAGRNSLSKIVLEKFVCWVARKVIVVIENWLFRGYRKRKASDIFTAFTHQTSWNQHLNSNPTNKTHPITRRWTWGRSQPPLRAHEIQIRWILWIISLKLIKELDSRRANEELIKENIERQSPHYLKDPCWSRKSTTTASERDKVPRNAMEHSRSTGAHKVDDWFEWLADEFLRLRYYYGPKS